MKKKRGEKEGGLESVSGWGRVTERAGNEER